MTSKPLYVKPHPVCRARYTLYMRHHSFYLCLHTHCTDNITLTLCMTSHSPYVWHRLHYTRHHILILWPQPPCLCNHTNYIWHCAHCICVITSTVLMISHKLYFWDHICYNSRHHIIVYDMTATVCHHNTAFMTSDSLHMTSPPGFMTSRSHTFDITATMFVNTCQLYLTSNTGC